MLLKRMKFAFHGFKCLLYDKGQIHTSIISKETQLNIILSNALPLSLSFLIRLLCLTLIYMGYFDNLFYMEGGKKAPRRSYSGI